MAAKIPTKFVLDGVVVGKAELSATAKLADAVRIATNQARKSAAAKLSTTDELFVGAEDSDDDFEPWTRAVWTEKLREAATAGKFRVKVRFRKVSHTDAAPAAKPDNVPLAAATVVAQPGATADWREFKPPRRNRMTYFNRGVGRKRRMHPTVHMPHPIPHDSKAKRTVKTCVYCGQNTTHLCSFCRAPLCTKVRPGTTESCFGSFHTSETLPPKKR